MRRFTFVLAALATLTASRFAHAQAEKKPIRLLAEAEDFKVEKGDWKPVPFRENYYASTFAVSFLSRMACLGAPAHIEPGQEAVATQAVQIPYDGDFHVLVRYEQPFNFSAEFTVEIQQGGKTAYKQLFGKVNEPRIWALNGHKRVPMERYWWGGTDNVVWQQIASAKLSKGPATIRLVAGPQLDGGKPRAMAAKRHVDTICLTNDTEGMEAQKKTNYLEFDGWLTQDGDVFVKFTNPQGGLGPCVIDVEHIFGSEHSPYYVHVRDWPKTKVLKSGRMTERTKYLLTGPRSHAVRPELLAPQVDPAKYTKADPKNPKAAPTVTIPDAEYLQPGDSSGWIPLGQVLDSMNNCQWSPKATYKGKVDGIHLKLEFAIPDGKGGLKTIKDVVVKGKPEMAGFEMPGNVAPNPDVAKVLHWPPVIRTQQEALQWLLGEVNKFPKKGSTPKRFLLYSIMGFGGFSSPFPEARQLALALGDNTHVNQEGKKRELVAHWGDPAVESIKKMEATRKGGFKDVYIVSYGDEIHLPPLPITDAELAQYLQQHGVKYDGPVKVVMPDPKGGEAAVAAARKHPLYYYSQLCAKEKGGKFYAAGTAYYASKGMLTGANYSPHANYLVSEMDYLRTFKLKAMSMPWSEDYVWQIPEFSVQVTGYLTSGLRAGARYHDMPVHMYVMPHSPGNTPRDFRLSFYTAVAHGSKMINYFCATPLAVGGTENYVATDDLGMWKQIHACSHEAGIFEDYVVDAKVRPGKVGLILSSVDDIMTGATNSTFAMHNNERKAIYYALRHSQVSVDFLSEDDVAEGRAKDYQVLYVTQQWLHSRGIKALKKWVENGGTLVAMVGGGFLDEFNKLNKETGELYGVKNQQITTDPDLVRKYLLEENKPFLTKQDLPPYRPIDTVTMGDTKGVPVIVWKQTLDPSDAKVLGTFADGKPAVIEKTHGKGRAILFGFLPGQAYLKSGLPLLPPDRGSTDAAFAHYLPTEMDVSLRKLYVDDLLPTSIVRPVVCSENLVESTVLDSGTKALAVPLLNFTGKRIDKLTVTIEGLASAKSVRSVEQGVLKANFAGGKATITLPIDIADMLLIDR